MKPSALHRNRWRLAAWGAAAVLILLPLVAMRFTTEVNWGAGDFAFAIAMVLFVGGTYEAAVRTTPDRAYRAAVALALAATLVVWWVNAAVGIIGSEDARVNLLFDAVPLVGLAGAVLVRFRAPGMARVMVAVAVAQGVVAVIAFAGGFGFTGPFTVFFAAMWLTSAGLFAKAARQARGRPGPGASESAR